MIRRDALREVGAYRLYFRSGAEDRDLWWRLMDLGEIHRIPERLLQYRVHPAGRSEVHRQDMISDAIVCDLSAVARHFDVSDRDLLEDYGAAQDIGRAVEGYARRIGLRYPVRTLAKFRALKRGNLAAGGWTTRSEATHDAIRDVLENPLSWPSWRLAAAAAFG